MNYENLLWQKQVHVYTSLLLATASIWLAANRIRGTGSLGDTALCCSVGILAFLATFSFAYGAVAWPVLIVHAILMRWNWKSSLSILALCTVTMGIYASVWVPIPHLDNPLESILKPFAVLHYLSDYMTWPLSSPIAPLLGSLQGKFMFLAGTVLPAVFFIYAVQHYLLSHDTHPQNQFSIMVGAFCLGIGLITALGRLTINHFENSRYLFIPILFLLALPGMVWTKGNEKSLHSHVALLLFAGVLLTATIGSGFTHADAVRRFQILAVEGALAAEFKISGAFHGLYQNKKIVDEVVWPHYRRRQNEIGRLLPHMWLGNSMSELPDGEDATACPGKVDGLEPVPNFPGNYAIVGWARHGGTGKNQADWVLVADSSKTIRGIGKPARKRPDVANALNVWFPNVRHRKSSTSGIVGFVRAEPGTELDFFAMYENKICLFDRDIVIPND